MIPQAYITEWSNVAPWQTNAQVEQDLIICRALAEIYVDDFLASKLAFRGGTALHKLYLQPSVRYSEDIDLVQMTSEPFGPVIDILRERLQFLGQPIRNQKAHNNTLLFRFESESLPVQTLRLKVETNCREHFAVLGYQKFPFEVDSSWFKGTCDITTFRIEELLGTKLRALYQRRKGRDLYDIYRALVQINSLDIDALLKCYHTYMRFVVAHPPSQKQFLQNLEAKMGDPDFLGDIVALIRPEEQYGHDEAFQLIKSKLIDNI